MIFDPFTGAGYFLRGIPLILSPGLRRYVIGPLLVNIAVFGGMIALGIHYFGLALDDAMSRVPDWLQWLAPILWLVFALSLALTVFFTFSMVANFLAAPFNNALAAAVERRLAPSAGSLNASGVADRSVASEAIGSFVQAGRKLGYLLSRAIPLAILSLVPVVNVIAAPLWLVFGGWMLALEYLDYPLANRNLGFSEVRTHAQQRRLLMLGFGGTVSVLTLIPVVNFLVMPVAVAGATALATAQWPRKEGTPTSR